MQRIDDVEIYYKSWSELYKELVLWTPIKTKGVDWKAKFGQLRAISIVGLILSIIPILPLCYLGLEYWYRIAILGLDNSEPGILRLIIVWLGFASTFVVLSFLNDYIHDKIPELDSRVVNEPPERLSEDQLTFIFSYEVYTKLNEYLTVRVDKNLFSAHVAFRNLFHEGHYIDFDYKSFLLGNEVSLIDNPVLPAPSIIYLREVIVRSRYASTHYAWWKIEKRTWNVFHAIMQMEAKLRSRIMDKQDLKEVRDIMYDFAIFTFAYLREHEDVLSPEDVTALRQRGEEHLDFFIERLNNLEPYYGNPGEKSMQEAKVRKNLIQSLADLHNHSILVRFLCGYLLAMMLIAVSLLVLRNIWPFHESIMAPTIVTLSFPVAIAYARFLENPR